MARVRFLGGAEKWKHPFSMSPERRQDFATVRAMRQSNGDNGTAFDDATDRGRRNHEAAARNASSIELTLQCNAYSYYLPIYQIKLSKKNV